MLADVCAGGSALIASFRHRPAGTGKPHVDRVLRVLWEIMHITAHAGLRRLVSDMLLSDFMTGFALRLMLQLHVLNKTLKRNLDMHTPASLRACLYCANQWIIINLIESQQSAVRIGQFVPLCHCCKGHKPVGSQPLALTTLWGAVQCRITKTTVSSLVTP